MHYDNAASPVTDIIETKIMINSPTSNARRGARFMTLDIKDHFLAIPMNDLEHVWARLKCMPDDTRQKHNIMNVATKDR